MPTPLGFCFAAQSKQVIYIHRDGETNTRLCLEAFQPWVDFLALAFRKPFQPHITFRKFAPTEINSAAVDDW